MSVSVIAASFSLPSLTKLSKSLEAAACVYCTVAGVVPHSHRVKHCARGFVKAHRQSAVNHSSSWDHVSILRRTLWHRHGCFHTFIQTGSRRTNQNGDTAHKSDSGATTEIWLFLNRERPVAAAALLCGKAGLQPAATEWTQYPDSGSHDLQSGGPPPAWLPWCQRRFQSFIFLSKPLQGEGWGTPFNTNQCYEAKDVKLFACDWEDRDNRPMC